MNSELIEKVQGWVEENCSNANHLVRTGYWVKKLYPKANDALVISAITHDIERAFKDGRIPPSPEFGGAKWDDPIYDEWHSERSAKIVAEFLKKENIGGAFIEEVSRLIRNHERGGWKEADILRDADSISFLEVNVSYFLSLIPEKLTKKEVKEKFDYMFRRIGSEKAMKFAKPFYTKAVEGLNKIKN